HGCGPRRCEVDNKVPPGYVVTSLWTRKTERQPSTAPISRRCAGLRLGYPLVTEAVHWGRNEATAVDEGIVALSIHRDDRGVAQQATEIHLVTRLRARHRDEASGGGLMVHHADRGLVGNHAGDELSRGIARDGDHVEADGANAGHGLELVHGDGPLAHGVDHALVLGHRDEGTGKPTHARASHHAALLHRIIK